MAKIICVLYDDPVDGYPKTYARDDVPQPRFIQTARPCRRPRRSISSPGALLGSVSGELGLRKYLGSPTATPWSSRPDKDGAKACSTANFRRGIVISQPFWPAYMTAERIAKAPKLKLIITAGIGSDHTDSSRQQRRMTVAEVTYCNSISVAEHVVMMILALVRNYIPSYQLVVEGRLEHRRLRRALLRPGSHAGWHRCRRPHWTRGAAPSEAVRRRAPLYRPARLPEAVEKELNSPIHPMWRPWWKACDVVTHQLPAASRNRKSCSTRLLAKMKRGATS